LVRAASFLGLRDLGLGLFEAAPFVLLLLFPAPVFGKRGLMLEAALDRAWQRSLLATPRPATESICRRAQRMV
jgi:hypothetical protein